MVIFYYLQKTYFLALEAQKNDTPILKTKGWRRKNEETKKWEVIPEIFSEYCGYGAELNILAFCTQFVPQEVINFPKYKTIIYHPSILPAHRYILSNILILSKF